MPAGKAPPGERGERSTALRWLGYTVETGC
jgi:hypothetical protein